MQSHSRITHREYVCAPVDSRKNLNINVSKIAFEHENTKALHIMPHRAECDTYTIELPVNKQSNK